jgi:CBS domain containing-hemolysin-like protein
MLSRSCKETMSILSLLAFTGFIYGLIALFFGFRNQKEAKKAYKNGQINPNFYSTKTIEGKSGIQMTSMVVGLTLIILALITFSMLALAFANLSVSSNPSSQFPYSSNFFIIIIFSSLGILLLTPVYIGINAPLVWNRRYAEAEAIGLAHKLPFLRFQRIITNTIWITSTFWAGMLVFTVLGRFGLV